MLTLLLSIIGIIITNWIIPYNILYPLIVLQTSILFFLSNILLNSTNNFLFLNNLSWNLGIDFINAPLIILSLWLFPVSLIASFNFLSNKPLNNIKIYFNLLLLILIALIITFSSSNLLLFFLGFETTLIPTLIIITNWGVQQERIEAGYYFVFYTLISSLPLFLCLIIINNNEFHLNISLFSYINISNSNTLLLLFCIIAFLVKVPIFGFHLWLPKAHVEAPVAGSMILAAILLKMGGYGFIRLITIFWEPFNNFINLYLIPFCCWGGVLTSLICLTQTDLKSLIAYSSVSHMSFMIAGLSIMSTWSISGSIILMIAHGIVSSALFSIANLYYERTNTRNLSINRGIKSSSSLFSLYWLLFCSANLGLPPFPNAIGELFLFSSIINFSNLNFPFILLGILFTAIFSLSIYQQLNSGIGFKWNTLNLYITEREYILLSLHLLPLILLILYPILIT